LQDNLSHRLLNSESNAAWQIMHGVIAYADGLPLQVGQERRSALDYLFHQGVVRGWELAPGDILPTTGRQG
ncbi:MAG: ADP-ribosylation factor-directed GTPase activating protein isoform b, partial [Pirellulaceae bacterium]